MSQQFLGSPDTTLAQLLDNKVRDMVEEDEMLESVISVEKAKQLKVNIFVDVVHSILASLTQANISSALSKLSSITECGEEASIFIKDVQDGAVTGKGFRTKYSLSILFPYECYPTYLTTIQVQ